MQVVCQMRNEIFVLLNDFASQIVRLESVKFNVVQIVKKIRFNIKDPHQRLNLWYHVFTITFCFPNTLFINISLNLIVCILCSSGFVFWKKEETK